MSTYCPNLISLFILFTRLSFPYFLHPYVHMMHDSSPTPLAEIILFRKRLFSTVVSSIRKSHKRAISRQCYIDFAVSVSAVFSSLPFLTLVLMGNCCHSVVSKSSNNCCSVPNKVSKLSQGIILMID